MLEYVQNLKYVIDIRIPKSYVILSTMYLNLSKCRKKSHIVIYETCMYKAYLK